MHSCPRCQSRLQQTDNTYQLNQDQCYRCGTEIHQDLDIASDPDYLDYLEDPRDTDSIDHFDLEDVSLDQRPSRGYNGVMSGNRTAEPSAPI